MLHFDKLSEVLISFAIHIIIVITVMYFEHKKQAKRIADVRNRNIRILFRSIIQNYRRGLNAQHPADQILQQNYAIGYVKALHDIASEEEIEAHIGPAFYQVEQDILEAQQKASAAFYTLCPHAFDSRVVPM